MSGYTEHYNLKKPAQSENYNVEDANTNNTIIDAILFGKVDKVAGKDLSSNDFTNEYKLKLDAMGKIYNYLGTVQNLDALGKIENSKKGDLYHVQSESADYAWNGTKWEKVDSNKGDTGVGITEIKCQESTDDSGINVITIKLSDGRETSFNVRNGTKGKTGEKGETGDTGPRGETGSYPVLISTATGNPVHIEDSSDLEMKLKLKGGHKQKTTKGKQLLNPADLIATITKNGLTLTNNGDGTFNISGTATADSNFVLWNVKNIYEANHYFGLYSSVTYNTTNWNLSLAITYTDGTATKYITPIIPVNATNENVNTANVVLYIPSGTTINQTNVKIMLYKDDSVQATEYEPYTGGQASPNPSYLQGIEAVGCNVNILPDVDGWEQGTVDNNTGETISSTTRLTNTGYIEVEPKTNYFASVQNDDYCFTNIILYDNKGTYIKDYYKINSAIKGAKALLIEIPEGCYKIKNVLRNADDTSNITTDEFPQIKAKFEKGNVQTAYSTHGEGSIEIKKENSNIMPINTGRVWAYTENGIKNLVGASGNSITNFNIKKNQKIKLGMKMLSKPIQDTSISIYANNKLITSFLHIDKWNLNQTQEITYTATEDCVIKLTLWGNGNSDLFEFQIWANYNTLKDYKRYEKETYILPIQQELLENDYIDDVEHHGWGKIILTGEETWSVENTGRFRILQNKLPFVCKKPSSSTILLGNLCNSYIEKTPYDTYNKIQGFAVDLSGNFTIYDNSYSKNSDLTGFKAMLAEKYNNGNPIVCYLKLATPIELELTKEQKAILNSMKTYKNETNIIADNELATMEVEYQTDAEVNELLNEQKEKMWGVGSIYTTTLEEDPAIILGLGKWIRKKILNGGELIAYGSAYNQGEQSDTVVNGAKLDFSDTKIPNKKFNIKNFVDGVLFDQGGTFKIATKGIVGLVKCNSKFCGLGGSGITGLWWQGNSNPLPTGVNLLSTNALLTGPYGEVYGGNTNTLLYEVTDEASDETEFYVNPVVNPYGGAFAPCQAGTKCSLEVEVYSKKQTTYVWERIS